MTTLKLLSTGLIAAALLGGPVMAREHHSVMRQPAMTTDTASLLIEGRPRLRSRAARRRFRDGAVDRQQRAVRARHGQLLITAFP